MNAGLEHSVDALDAERVSQFQFSQLLLVVDLRGPFGRDEDVNEQNAGYVKLPWLCLGWTTRKAFESWAAATGPTFQSAFSE